MELTDVNALLTEALRLQEDERATAFAEPSPALVVLTTVIDGDEVLRSAESLRAGGVNERQLYSRIVANCRISAARRLALLTEVLASESEPAVIRWLVVGIRNTRDSSALPVLYELANHASADVRFPVPDALSACARHFDDIADTLIRLSEDPDSDVRWSAVFELVAWSKECRDHRLRARLASLATTEPVAAIRTLAEEGN